MQRLLSTTQAIDSLRQYLPVLRPDAAIQALSSKHSSVVFYYLYREFFPSEWAESTSSKTIIRDSSDGLTPREIEFLMLVKSRLFPISGINQCSEDNSSLIAENIESFDCDSIHLINCGIDWAYDMSDGGLSLDEFDNSLQLLLPLTVCGRYAIEATEAIDWYIDTWNIDLSKIPARNCISADRLLSLTSQAGEPITFLKEALDVLDYSTDNPWLDNSSEGGADRTILWSSLAVRQLTHAYKEAKGILDRAYQLLDWLDRNPNNFKKILKIWKRCQVKL